MTPCKKCAHPKTLAATGQEPCIAAVAMAVYNIVTSELRCLQENLTSLNLLCTQGGHSFARTRLTCVFTSSVVNVEHKQYLLVLSNGQRKFLFLGAARGHQNSINVGVGDIVPRISRNQRVRVLRCDTRCGDAKHPPVPAPPRHFCAQKPPDAVGRNLSIRSLPKVQQVINRAHIMLLNTYSVRALQLQHHLSCGIISAMLVCSCRACYAASSGTERCTSTFRHSARRRSVYDVVHMTQFICLAVDVSIPVN